MPSGRRQDCRASAISAGMSFSEPKRAGEVGGGQHAVADGGEIARAAAADGEARQRAGEIGRRLQARAGVGARRAVIDEARHRVEPPRDRSPDR